MTSDRDDDALLEWLRQVAAEADPLPEDIGMAAREAITLHDLDGELAELIADSAGTTPDLEYETVRRAAADTTADRLLSFEGGDVRVELEIVPGDDGLTVVGELVGASPDGCELEYGDGRRETVQLDELGRFLLDRKRGGPVRIRCRSVHGSPVVTAWVNL
ncbi:hypothetical protein EV652_107511 [Kribbella steppae]|uniref:Uncharacterized protein n=1 Tax=Kribbella steppae TaxID=2512223 RepID=A0A4V2RZK2_9ACTN|nr:hypothetical protein [Kribbella steppae]TCO26618.1 hypothetical protein EV652_107511 [Kribbella steppae]